MAVGSGPWACVAPFLSRSGRSGAAPGDKYPKKGFCVIWVKSEKTTDVSAANHFSENAFTRERIDSPGSNPALH